MPFEIVLSVCALGKYSGFACNICYTTMAQTPLLRCCGCRLIFYCSKQHQLLHWPHHKKLCKATQSLMRMYRTKDLFLAIFKNERQYHQLAIESLVLLCEDIMKRRLSYQEYLLFNNPYFCKVCRVYNDGCMVVCEYCSAVVYCSKKHKKEDLNEHYAVCHMIQNCLDFDRELSKGLTIFLKIPDILQTLPPDIHSFLEVLTIETNPRRKEEYAINHLGDALSVILTIIYAIEKGCTIKQKKGKRLVIHLVGSRQYENSALEFWEYMFHYFSTLESLDLIFIGPDASEQYLEKPIVICDDCINHREINFKIESMKYHEYLRKGIPEKPDLIIALHCGFYEYKYILENDAWTDSMESFCSFPDTVFTFTSYNHNEAKEDLKIFKESCNADFLKVLVESEPNPFRSTLPFPKVGEIASPEIIYFNPYITIVKT